jgi:glycosyltransferase involved in cell wall biosynthesis
MPEVSVVIPTYNSARYLEQALGSVLAQTFQDLEIIVVDDGSTDETSDVIGDLGAQVQYIQQRKSGVSVARNHGVAKSTGRYVAFLDADDVWLPHKLARQIDALRNVCSGRLCHSAFLVSDAHLKPLEVRRAGVGSSLETLLFHGNVVGSPSTVICDRELLRSAGGFDPDLSQCADWDLWIRLAAHAGFLYLDEPLVRYRKHELSMSMDPRLLESDSLRVLEKGFAVPGIDPALARQKDRALARNYMVLAGTYVQAGHYRDFVRCAARSLSLDPRRAGYLARFPLRAGKRLFNRPRR